MIKGGKVFRREKDTAPWVRVEVELSSDDLEAHSLADQANIERILENSLASGGCGVVNVGLRTGASPDGLDN